MIINNWINKLQIKSLSLLGSSLGIRRLRSYFTNPRRNLSELPSVKERGSGNAAS